MNVYVYNAALVVGWLLVLVGAMLVHGAAGLMVGGFLLLILVFVTVRLGGLYAPERNRG